MLVVEQCSARQWAYYRYMYINSVLCSIYVYVLFFVYIQTMALVTTKQLKKTGQTYHQFKVSLNYQVYVNDLNEESKNVLLFRYRNDI